MEELPRNVKSRWATREQFNGSPLRLVLDNLAGSATNRTAA
jgi:hypothetical protein